MDAGADGCALSRRGFLKLAGVFLLLSFLPKALTPATFGRVLYRNFLASRIKSLFRTRESAEALGRRYLELYPEDAHTGKILSDFEKDHGWTSLEMASAGRREFERLVRDAIADDFRMRRTVSLESWVLSRTEARLCALTALGFRG